MTNEPFRQQLRWADRISCHRDGDTLWISGDLHEEANTDLMKGYDAAEFSPHVRFANSCSDEELIDFTNTYGPVIVSAAESAMPSSQGADTHLGEHLEPKRANRVRELCDAFVLWEDLRAEQRFYAALLDLTHTLLDQERMPTQQRRSKRDLPVSRVSRRKRCDSHEAQVKQLQSLVQRVRTVVENTRSWEVWLRQEQRARRRAEYVDAHWTWGPAQQEQVESAASEIESYLETEVAGRDHEWFTPDPQHYLKAIIITILNAFPSSLSWVVAHVEEVPAQDLLFGIRPALIAMLRRDVMLKREVRLCIRQGCGRYFIATRSNQGCCTRKCREMVNNRLQYDRHTKPKRQREAKRKRRKKG